MTRRRRNEASHRRLSVTSRQRDSGASRRFAWGFLTKNSIFLVGRRPSAAFLNTFLSAINVRNLPLRHHSAGQPIISSAAALCQLFDLPLAPRRLSRVGGPVASAAKLFVVSDCFITVAQQPYNVLGRPN